jgi:DNA-directed RNA polymerase, mitochondrial
VTPPLPWLSSTMGGYLLNQTDLVRLPVSANEQDLRLRSLPTESIGGLLDSINVLNGCAWKINTPVLDLLIDVFQRGGSRQFSVPVSIKHANIAEPLPIEKVDEKSIVSLVIRFSL